MSATSGTSGTRLRISLSASAASLSGTARRTISQPAATISSICLTDTANVDETVKQIEEMVAAGCEAHDLATGSNHLLNLLDGLIDVRGVRLRHRLNDDRRAAADLHVLDLNWFRFAH